MATAMATAPLKLSEARATGGQRTDFDSTKAPFSCPRTAFAGQTIYLHVSNL